MLLHKHEFQVTEYYDREKNKVWKVELQHRHLVKDEHNNVIRDTGFLTVPRFRIDMSENT